MERLICIDLIPFFFSFNKFVGNQPAEHLKNKCQISFFNSVLHGGTLIRDPLIASGVLVSAVGLEDAVGGQLSSRNKGVTDFASLSIAIFCKSKHQ